MRLTGVGTHIPSVLLSALKVRGLHCGVTEKHVSTPKNKRILAAIEAPLMSGYLYAHQSVLRVKEGGESPQVKQMRLFDPSTNQNEDDYLDSLAGAISTEPIKIGQNNLYPAYSSKDDWRPSNQYLEMKIDFDL